MILFLVLSASDGFFCVLQLIKLLELEKDVGDARQWYLHTCNIHDKDRLQEIFQNFNKILTENLEREIEKRKSNSPTHSQRL